MKPSKGQLKGGNSSSLEDIRVGDNHTEVNLNETRFITSTVQILSDDQRKGFFEKIVLKITTISGNGLSTYFNMLLSWSYGGMNVLILKSLNVRRNSQQTSQW